MNEFLYLHVNKKYIQQPQLISQSICLTNVSDKYNDKTRAIDIRSAQLQVLDINLFKVSLILIFIKQYKQEVNDDLSVCLNQCRTSIAQTFLNLSQGNGVTTTPDEAPYEHVSRRCTYPNLITVALPQLEMSRFGKVK